LKLLFDESLSRKLVVHLAELYPGSAHVRHFDLLESPDLEIWEFAKISDFVIVSTDADFYELATTIGRLPRSSGSGDGPTRQGTLSGCCAARPSGSRNSRPIRNLVY
jgi:hypothetical protein